MKKVSLGINNSYGMGIHKPRRIEIWLSADDKQYRKIAEQFFEDAEIFREGMFAEEIRFDLNDESRFVRIVAYGAGTNPQTHVRPGLYHSEGHSHRRHGGGAEGRRDHPRDRGDYY